jgi:diketogulonate reductase-like aldo/keto reductase
VGSRGHVHRENLEAAELELTPAELARIAALDQGYRMIAGAFWAVAGTPWMLEAIWDEP